jgi:hypothetical protein
MSWETVTIPDASDDTPAFIGDQNDGAAGVGTEYARDDHVHPSTITGATNWQTDGNANEGKIYAVYK